MSNRLLLLVYVVFVFSMFADPVNGAESSAQEQPQVFDNQDIEKYSSPSDAKTKDAKTVLREDREESLKDKKKSIAEEHEMEYWCKRASAYKKKIKKADEDVKETEEKISEESGKGLHAGKKTSLLQKRLEKARKKVQDAGEDLGELEDEAHRKGVPPGWLRCQK